MPGMDSQSYVLDVGAADFESRVLKAPSDVLVLVDFWAEWCAPCRQLGPVLEKLAGEANGTMLLAKVNVDEEQQLAQIFQVQSIPFVVAIKGGKPVDAFPGAIPEPELRKFCEELGVQFGGPAPIEDAEIVDAPFPMAKAALQARDAAGFAAQIEGLEEIDEDEDEHTDVQRLLEARAFFAGEIAGEGAAADALRAAHAAWSEGALERALDHLLESLGESKDFGEELARKALVALFVVHAEQEELVRQTRRRMALLLH
jgi:putative thioredoxin